MNHDVTTDNTSLAQINLVYELRTYRAKDGKLTDLIQRFRDHTIRLFKKHGMKDIAFWVPSDKPARENTLIYLLEHKSRRGAAESWKELLADPEWIEVAAQSEANGKLVESIESIFLDNLDRSWRAS